MSILFIETGIYLRIGPNLNIKTTLSEKKLLKAYLFVTLHYIPFTFRYVSGPHIEFLFSCCKVNKHN